MSQKLKRLLLLTVILLFGYFYLISISLVKLQGFVHSAYFYRESGSLGKNAIAIVLTVNQNRIQNNSTIELKGTGVHGLESLKATIFLEPEENYSIYATALIQANFKNTNLQKLEIDVDGNAVEIPFKVVNLVKKHPIVFCISPQKISDNWQEFIVQVHTVKHFGAHLHYYLNHVSSPFYDLIRIYEKLGYLSSQPWIQFDKSTAGAAFTDCQLQYKESSRYVAFLGPNEFILPSGVATYYEEFMREFGEHDVISSLKYERFSMETRIEDVWSLYSIKNIVKSGQISATRESGRLVIQTRCFNSTGSRFSVNANSRKLYSRVTKRVRNGILRLKNIAFLNETIDTSIPNAVLRDIPLITEEQLTNIENNWNRIRNNIWRIGQRLQNLQNYSVRLKNCFLKHSENYSECQDLIRSQPRRVKCLNSKATLRCEFSKDKSCRLDFAIQDPKLIEDSECLNVV